MSGVAGYDGTGGDHSVPHHLQPVQDLPRWHAELDLLLLVVVGLRLVAHLLRQQSDLVVIQSLYCHPPFDFVFPYKNIGHPASKGFFRVVMVYITPTLCVSVVFYSHLCGFYAEDQDILPLTI